MCFRNLFCLFSIFQFYSSEKTKCLKKYHFNNLYIFYDYFRDYSLMWFFILLSIYVESLLWKSTQILFSNWKDIVKFGNKEVQEAMDALEVDILGHWQFMIGRTLVPFKQREADDIINVQTYIDRCSERESQNLRWWGPHKLRPSSKKRGIN